MLWVPTGWMWDGLERLRTLTGGDVDDEVVETWLDDTISDSEIFIQGYSTCRLDRTRHGGGVLMYIKCVLTLGEGYGTLSVCVLPIY